MRSFKQIWKEDGKFRKLIGLFFVVVGFVAIITPMTPVGFLFFVGLEILGVRVAYWERIKNWFKRKYL